MIHQDRENTLQNEFAREAAASLEQTIAGLAAEVASELKLNIHVHGKRVGEVDLHHAFKDWQANPDEKDEIIARFVSAYQGALEVRAQGVIERSKILPVLKHYAFLEKEGQREPRHRLTFEIISDELVVVYAMDTPQTLRFLRNSDVAALGLNLEELHNLALDNLGVRFPTLRVTHLQGVHQFDCDDYTPSLVLADGPMNQLQHKVAGELVVAVPARGYLLATGSEDRNGLHKLSELAAQVVAASPYPLSPKLLLRRGGQYVPFSM
jgi:uncharacterized protein YtpQ (UPF0354 family)